MIGNAHDAALALSDYRGNVYDRILSADGCSRMVYLINGVVYKVEGIVGTNESEYDNINNMVSSLPTGVFYPETSLFNIEGENVIAMQYIEGQSIGECYCIKEKEACDAFCMTGDELSLIGAVLFDTSGFNVIRNDEGYWIIDAA